MAFIVKNHRILSVIILIITNVTLAFKANAQGPAPAAPSNAVAQFCDPDGDLVTCGKVIGNAKTWEEAMTTSINTAIGELTKGQNALEGLHNKIDSQVDAAKRDNIVTVCKDGFDTVMDSLKESLLLVKNDPTLGLNNKVSAAFSGFSECIDVLTEDENQKGEIRELTGLNIIIQQHVYICLMVANRDPRVKNYYQKLEQGVDE